MSLVVRILATALALWVATVLVSGIDVTGDTTATNVMTLIIMGVIFGLINAFIKPLIKTLGFLLYIITLGLIALVVNALLLLLADWIAEVFNIPFEVDGFWPAFWGAIVVGLVVWLVSLVVPDRERIPAA